MTVKFSGSDGLDESKFKGAALYPVGTTAQRPSVGEAGMIRYNTDLHYFEWFDAELGAWRALSESDFTS